MGGGAVHEHDLKRKVGVKEVVGFVVVDFL